MGGEWPEQPSLRFLIHWALRREELCDPGLCHDAPDSGGRCDHCPLDKLDAAQSSELGLLLRRTVELQSAIKVGIRIHLDEIRADEFAALLILEEERDRVDRKSLARSEDRHTT